MKRTFLILSLFFILILASFSFAEHKKYGIGAKFFLILPTITGQYWFSENFGIGASLSPYTIHAEDEPGSGGNIFQQQLIFEKELSFARLFLGIGTFYLIDKITLLDFINSYTLGLGFGNDKLTITPAIEYINSSGRLTALYSLSSIVLF